MLKSFVKSNIHLNKQRLFGLGLILLTTVVLGACGQGGFKATVADSTEKGTGTPRPNEPETDLSICSQLSLKGVTWPSIAHIEKRSLALGLNISGSFEGSLGWKNITNNFDGQGLSLGLLNQCLGQGSLQPLLVKFRDRASGSLTELMSSAHRSSLLGMLTKWEGAQKLTSASVSDGSGDLLPDGRLSLLDELPDGSDGRGSEESASGDSVAWAKSALYTDGGTTFVSSWKKELQALSSHSGFVSIQIEAAMKLHTKTLSYMKTLGLREVRSYLMMFDICVQNGGLYQDDIDQFKKVYPAASGSEESRLRKILELRVRHVVAKYKNDVIARKTSIIVGKGVVHQTNRAYETEYCYDGGSTLL